MSLRRRVSFGDVPHRTATCNEVLKTNINTNSKKSAKLKCAQVIKTISDCNHHETNNTPESMSTAQAHNNVARNFSYNQRVPGIRRSQSESSADEFTKHTTDKITTQTRNMWQNELSMNPASTAAQPVQHKTNKDACAGSGDGIYRPSAYCSTQFISDLIDIAIRILIVILFCKLELMTPFKREIHIEELWLYKNPRTPDIVTPVELLGSVILAPFCITLLHYLCTKDKQDFRAGSWAWTLALCLNGIPTSLLKITVGRPRPDFYYRCFPDGIMVLNNETSTLSLDLNCTGKLSDINEGRKSFPSGHSSFAFASYGFIAYYVGAKLHAFNARGRGHTWRLVIALLPLLLAVLVAVSRTCDYHHHWQDVIAGAFIGLAAGYVAYRQYYPSLFSLYCDRPLMRWPKRQQQRDSYMRIESDSETDNNEERRKLINTSTNSKQSGKWY